MKKYSIDNTEELIEKFADLFSEKRVALMAIVESLDVAKKELKEIAYAEDQLMASRVSGVVNAKTMEIIQKYIK